MIYEEFTKIFSSNMNVVEEYVLENSSVETIEKWTQKKAKKLNKKAKPSRGKNILFIVIGTVIFFHYKSTLHQR